MKIINGQELSKSIRLDIRNKVDNFYRQPCLVVVLVGNNPASQVYVKNKEKACNECGFKSVLYKLNEKTTEKELIELIEKLNNDNTVDGILVQAPLPDHINFETIMSTISPYKDVDCFNPINVGKFFIGKNYFTVPCTASGCIKLIKTVETDLSGKKAVVIGRSNIVGKPVAQMLLNENCSVIITHSKTKNLEELTKQADIIIVAIGKPKFLKSNMVKDGTIIIDVGINRLEDGSICGDVDFEGFKNRDCYLTPVPKGVGPMTIACLLENTLKCFNNNR